MLLAHAVERHVANAQPLVTSQECWDILQKAPQLDNAYLHRLVSEVNTAVGPLSASKPDPPILENARSEGYQFNAAYSVTATSKPPRNWTSFDELLQDMPALPPDTLASI